MSIKDCLNLTEYQLKAIDELSKRMQKENGIDPNTIEYDARTLYRFLKARDFDVNKSEIMLRKSLEWRKQNEYLVRNHKPPEIVSKYFSNMIMGYDKEGNPVVYLPLGKYDVKGLHMAAKYADIERYITSVFLEYENHLENANGQITRVILIADDDEITFANAVSKVGLETLLRLAKLQQDIFPERLKAVYVINAPSYHYIAWNIIKHVFSPETLKKIHVYGADGWREDLLKEISSDQWPAFLGGTRTDPDGNILCKTILNQGGPIPESYYIHRSKTSLAKSPGVQKLHISRSSLSEIPFEISKPGSAIEWEFEISSGDIVFGINYRRTDGSEDVVFPFQRLNTKDFAEAGVYKCEKAGTYVVVFDNSYSWFRSKEIFYRISVEGNDEHEDHFRG